MTRKLAGWLLVAFLAFYAITDPTGAAHGAHHVLAGLAHLARSLGAFISALTTTHTTKGA